MKDEFKVGDLVRHKLLPEWGKAIVVEVTEKKIMVEWFYSKVWYYSNHFVLCDETPIQRMKRLYSED